jgi:hypothetical protein
MVYELVIESKEDEVFAISLVEDGAIESNFVYFNKDEVKFSAVDNEKRLVMGALLIPNKQILRIDGQGVPYYVFFKPDTIRKLSEKYLEKKYTDKATLEHNKAVDDITLVESWIVESAEKDKSKLYGINVPAGTWMGTMKINNDEVWNNYVKTGKVKGFSIEGIFGHNLVSAARVELDLEKSIELLSDAEVEILLQKIKSVILEAQPSIVSSYPGEAISGSIAPALLQVESPNIDVLGYDTKNFEICPGAISLFEHLTEMVSSKTDDELFGMIRSAAVVADTIFRIEKEVISAGTATSSQLDGVRILVKDFRDIMREIDEDLGMTHDTSFMDGHIKIIESYL